MGLIVDLFAGGGGASLGIEAALGRDVDIAINHDPVAIAVHAANHPRTEHYATDIWEVDPRTATRGRPVDLLHASPDCKHFSRAKGGKPKSQKIRSLAWVVHRWAQDVRPKVITLENVAEFEDWGPLGDDDRPIPEKRGLTFKIWKGKLEALGYAVEHRVLHAHHYGAPTSRKRFFLVARCDGKPIAWPEPTHGPILPIAARHGRAVAATGLRPYRTAAECIDWSLPCPSIFERSRPLAENTLRRIAAGIVRFVLSNPHPFIVPIDPRQAVVVPFIANQNHSEKKNPADNGTSVAAPLRTILAGGNHRALVAPTLIQTSYGEREGQAPRVLDLHQPLGTVVAQGQKHALVSAFLAQHYQGQVGHELTKPVPTITAIDHHSLTTATLGPTGERAAEVRAFLTTYYGSEGEAGQSLRDPMRTVVTKDRFGLVTIAGVEHQIIDIGMRMLEPHELARAQFGRFADGFDMSAAKTKKDQVRLVGNSVCPELEEALIRAQFPNEATRKAA